MAGEKHEFGSHHTDLKLAIVEKYLSAYTTALRRQFKHLWYIDAFAGTGSRTVRHAAREPDMISTEGIAERIEQRRGSARIAMDTEPQFDRLIFIDAKASHCAALRELAARHPHRDITVVQEDANKTIRAQIEWDGWKGTRAVMFLDPYGMEVDWTTLEAVARTQAIDVWYLVSLSGLFRQATNDPEKITPEKRAALTRMLGTTGWETEWYVEEERLDMFGHVIRESRRGTKVPGMERFVQDRLSTIFAKVLPPKRLYNDRGVPIFSLFFAISNRDPKAIGLATRIAGHMLR